MNDWWNDPPDDQWEEEDAPVSENYDTLEEYKMDTEAYVKQEEPLCPHGNEWGSCDRCDYEGDIAYDASREKR